MTGHGRRSGDGTWEKILDQLRAGCDEGRGQGWTVGAAGQPTRGPAGGAERGQLVTVTSGERFDR